MTESSGLRVKSSLVAAAVGAVLPSLSCNPGQPAVGESSGLYRVEVLTENIDPTMIPDPLQADFDEDGELDQVIVTDSSVWIELTGGGEFDYSVREPGDESPRIWDAKVFSLRPDGKFPSIMLATCPEPSHGGYPVTQELIYNDSGKLVRKRLGAYPWTNMATSVSAYPMRALGLDCAWLKTSDLPVCFFASMEDGALGVSRLIELDPAGYMPLVSDSATRAHFSWRIGRRWGWIRRVAQRWKEGGVEMGSARGEAQAWLGVDSTTLDRVLPAYLPGPRASASDTLLAASEWVSQADPRRQAQAYLRMDRLALDSALAAVDIREPAEAVDYFLAVALSQLDRTTLFSNDITREYRLPWPAQPGHGRNAAGRAMVGAAFLDFSGDGLLDLVAVGQHSRPFSAIQHSDGYFTEAAFHETPDEYVRVWAPHPAEDGEHAVPPCVYFGMEKTEEEAWRSDYVDCYDSVLGEWYEVELPQGPYWTEFQPVMFWDMNKDGMIDFAARTAHGTWNVLTFLHEEATPDAPGRGSN